MKKYTPSEIEPKWQQIWDERQTYKANLDSDKPKYIAMSMFNYPSGAGIHIGHAMNYTISDVMARYKRQQGYESYHPVGWDSFGLPAENYAIKTGISPQQSMANIIPGYHKQYKAMGWSNDWSKEISTHEPSYYKWTQWIFSQMYRHDLVYQEARMQWWCTKCQTVLSNEQVIDGKCWRHDGADDLIVEKKEVKQWFFRITDYAEELLEATDALDWSEAVKTAQKNWIGKSKGAEIDFVVEDSKQSITVFTTRPDTLFGATFLVVAPEHDIVDKVVTLEQKDAVAKYIKESTKKTEVERQASKEKTGVFTGSYAINPINNQKIPIWIADYVLVGYGTGAIMAVPAHDERDNEFAKKFKLPIVEVVEPQFGEANGDEVHKDAVIAVVRNPKTNEVLVLDWGPRHKNWGGNLFIGGGIEPGEDPVECAKREIAEETGYQNVKYLKTAPSYVNNYFYSNVKDKNYHARFLPMLFELEDEVQIERNLDDNEDQFTISWIPDSKVALTITDEAHMFGYKLLHEEVFHGGEGVMINSGKYNGLKSSDAREKIVADLEVKSLATEKTTYKLRDWSVSRQRYWGAPIPIIYCDECGPVLVPDDQLPVVLPELEDFQPSGDGRSALARATDWLNVDCPQCGGRGQRETDTLDTYICSSWYYLRYFDSANKNQIFDSNTVNKWMPIDFYNGADHATAHMIYARFVTRFLSKIGLVENPEPFKKFLFNGKIMASDGQMFSKSKGNGVDPLEIINQGYGSDSLRTYLMFAAPLDLWVRWDPQGVPGAYRFLNRIWNLSQEFITSDQDGGTAVDLLKLVHPAIRKVTEDLEDQKYNTAIATMMKLTNSLYDMKAKNGFTGSSDWRFTLESLVMMVAPFAPHTADELWSQLGYDDSVNVDHWPVWDERYLVQDEVTIVVQVNGKLRSTITIPADSSREDIELLARADEKAASYIGSEVKKVIVVPKKLINFVV